MKADFTNTGQLVPDALGRARQYFEHGHWMSESHDEYDVHEFAALSQAAALIAIAEELRAIRAYLDGGDLHPADEVERAGRCPMCDCK